MTDFVLPHPMRSGGFVRVSIVQRAHPQGGLDVAIDGAVYRLSPATCAALLADVAAQAHGNAAGAPFVVAGAAARAGPGAAGAPPPARPLVSHAAATDAPKGALTAPAGGRIAAIRVAVGEAVAPGQVVVVLEAMKVELAVRAEFAGVVQGVAVAVGGWVEPEAVLLTMA